MEVMTDVLVGWVQMGWYPSRFVSNALARAGSPGGRTGGREPDKESDFFGRFRNTQSSPIGARFSRRRSGALRVQMGCTPHLIASVFRSRLLNCGLSMSACDPLADSNHTPRHDRNLHMKRLMHRSNYLLYSIT
jgi:hypothetical protein